jgi:exodeoxyribonuclease VII large subunit
MALPVRAELIATIGNLGGRMARCLTRNVEKRRLELKSAASRFPRLDILLQNPRQRLDMAAQRFGGALGRALSRKRALFDRASGGLRPAALRRDTSVKRAEAHRLAARLGPAMARRLKASRDALQAQTRVLDSVSHERVLARGFALVTGSSGGLLRSAAAIAEGDALRLRFSDGEVAATAGKGSPASGSSSGSQRPRIRRAKRGDDQGSLF